MSAQISSRWPRIAKFLRLDSSTGWVDDYLSFTYAEDRLGSGERAAAYEEWADFYEWRLEQRAGELATDRVRRHLVAEWTASMAYSLRRSAAFARGEDPGEWVPLSTRRPDLAAERQALVAEIVAKPIEQLAATG